MGMWSGIQYIILHFWGLLLYLNLCHDSHVLPTFFSGLNFKRDMTFFCYFLFFYNMSGISVIGFCGNLAHNRFTSYSMCSINVSIQSLPRYIFYGSRISPCEKFLCIHHPDGTYWLFCIWYLIFLLNFCLLYFFSLLFTNSF